MIKVLQKFGMMDNKPMMTPMISDLKKLGSQNYSLMDPACSRQLIESLMYLVNT